MSTRKSQYIDIHYNNHLKPENLVWIEIFIWNIMISSPSLTSKTNYSQTCVGSHLN